MQYEYFIFNLIIISGPLIFGLSRRFYFFDKWRTAASAIILAAIPYLVWDALVTGSHWLFNEKYVMGIYLARLPIEEWLFFVSVPFACLYSWEMIKQRSRDTSIVSLQKIQGWFIILSIPGFVLYFIGLQYTGLVLIFIALVAFLDNYLDTHILSQKRFYIFLLLVIGFTLIFNGFLTWRPVVLYGEEFQIGFRIFTIPVEDFGYGISLIYLNVILYEKLKIKKPIKTAFVG